MNTPHNPTGTTTELLLLLMAKPLEATGKALRLNTPGLLVATTLIADALKMGLMLPTEDSKKIKLAEGWHTHPNPVAQSLAYALHHKYQQPEHIAKPKTALTWLTTLHNRLGLPKNLRKMAELWNVWTVERQRVMRIFNTTFIRPTNPEMRQAAADEMLSLMRGERSPSFTEWLVIRYLQQSHHIYSLLAFLPKPERKAAAKRIAELMKHPGEAVTQQLEKLGESLRMAFDDNTTAVMVMVSSS